MWNRMNLNLRKAAQAEFEFPYPRLNVKIMDKEIFAGLWSRVDGICREHSAEFWSEFPIIFPDNVTLTVQMYNFPTLEDANIAAEKIKQLFRDNNIQEAAMKLSTVDSDPNRIRYEVYELEWVWNASLDRPTYFPEIDFEDFNV